MRHKQVIVQFFVIWTGFQRLFIHFHNQLIYINQNFVSKHWKILRFDWERRVVTRAWRVASSLGWVLRTWAHNSDASTEFPCRSNAIDFKAFWGLSMCWSGGGMRFEPWQGQNLDSFWEFYCRARRPICSFGNRLHLNGQRMDCRAERVKDYRRLDALCVLGLTSLFDCKEEFFSDYL